MNKNKAYQNADSASIYNIKQNLNTFLGDFADLDFTNNVPNNRFSFVDTNLNLLYWQAVSATGTYNSTLGYFPATISPSGSFSQNIQATLKTNTNYTLTFYGSCATTGSMSTIMVMATSANQIFNINNPLEINQASMTMNSSVSGLFQKHTLNFRTTSASAISGTISVMIQNMGNMATSCNLKNIIVYSSLIELGDLPNNRDLAVHSHPISDVNGLSDSISTTARRMAHYFGRR